MNAMLVWPVSTICMLLCGMVVKLMVDRQAGTLIMALAYTSGSVGMLVSTGIEPSALTALGGVWFAWLAWKEWRQWWNGGGRNKTKKTAKAWGDKTRRIVQSMADKMTPSPTPQPQ